jgi:hypothetical protein
MQNTNEDLLSKYFESFFDNSDQYFKYIEDFGNIYKESEVSDWLDEENRFKIFLPYGNLQGFYIELAENCSFFIKKIFDKYVDDNTFVVGSYVHSTINEKLDTTVKRYSLTYNDTKTLDIDKILNKYKESGCKKIFLYGAGILESNIVPQSFYIKLKERLVKENIEHIFVLDDVQSMFIIPRDYSIFNYVLFTCHSLIPNFDSGIMLSKEYEGFGYHDADMLRNFLNSLQIILTKRDKLALFNVLMQQYYAEELASIDFFDLPKNPTLNIFYICIKDEVVKKIILKYEEELKSYGITISGNIITIRENYILKFESKYILEGLKKLKNILQKAIKLKDRM